MINPPAGLKGFTPVGPRPTESVLSSQGYASKALFANFEEIVPLDFGKPSGKSHVRTALFRCCDAPQKIKKERKGEERRERKRRKEGKEERKRRKGREERKERKRRKGREKRKERKGKERREEEKGKGGRGGSDKGE